MMITPRRAVAVIFTAGLLLSVAACSLLGPNYRAKDGQITATASIDMDSLHIGDCIFNISGLADSVSKVQVVPCSSPHEGEVYAIETNVTNNMDDIQQYCTDQFEPYVGVSYDSTSLSAMDFRAPDSQSKTAVQCVVYDEGQTVTTSYKGSNK